HQDPTRVGSDVSHHGNQGYDLATQPFFRETCDTCHDPHGSPNLAAIRTIVAGDSIQFFNRSGDFSFDPPGDDNSHDICTTCHGTTRHNSRASNWREQPHYEGQDCTQCHKHESDGDPTTADAFMPQGGCLDCHNQPQDNGDNRPPGGRRAVAADFTRATHHIKGESADEKCLVCHDQATHGDGWIDLRQPDGGQPLRFQRADDADLTPFCQGCHDADGSQRAIAPGGSNLDPFRDGANLLAMARTSTHANTAFHDAQEGPFSIGCNQCHSGHGSDNLALIRPTINGNPITFLSRTGKDSFDDPDREDRKDLCVTCHLGLADRHPGGDHRPSGDLDLRGSDCTTCHRHDADQDVATADAFMPSCNSCHGQPPPPSADVAYPLDETVTPHRKHAGNEPGQYGMACSTCHDRTNPAYSGHVTEPASFQDVFFDARNPAGSYDRNNRTCANLGCHSNGSPEGGVQVFQTPAWNEFSTLTCAGCHPDQNGLQTGSHARHLTAQYGQRGGDAIGCYECHADTARDDDNNAIGNTNTHVDFQKQVRMDLSDLFGVSGQGVFNPADNTCANSLCHSDGAASREVPGAPRFSTPRWGDPSSAACGSCHEFSPDRLSTGAHARHFDVSEQGPGIAACETCHTTVTAPTHVNGRVDFADGKTLSQTAVCDRCHSPGGAVDGVAEARANWVTDTPVSCEGCHDSQPSVVKGVAAPDVVGDGLTYGALVTGHGQERIAVTCQVCHVRTADSNHFDGIPNSYDAEADNFQQTRWLSIPMNVPMQADELYSAADYGLCYTCHSEPSIVGLAEGYSNALFTHTSPPPPGYPLMVPQVKTLFRNERPEGYNFGNVPANIHWDHLDMNRTAWDSDGDGAYDSRPSCITCHDPHGVRSVADGVAYPAMTYADMGITRGQDAAGQYGAVTKDGYLARCSTCHSGEVRYYRPLVLSGNE
ncbi:MAG: CxxxxCH/CxxCH domain-containing protein, partial [Caldilineae bacterium]